MLNPCAIEFLSPCFLMFVFEIEVFEVFDMVRRFTEIGVQAVEVFEGHELI